MKPPRVKSLLFLLLALTVSAARAGGNGWEDEKDEWEKMAGTRFYKDPGYAAKLSVGLLPMDMGHFYVGEVPKGVWSSVGQTVSLAAVGIPLLNAQGRSKRDKDPVWTSGMIATAAVGGLGYIALKVWSAFDAAQGARRYNAAQEAEQKKHSWRWDLGPRDVRVSRRF
jgi:hypothetical protein